MSMYKRDSLSGKKKWYGTHMYKPNGEWDHVAKDMMIIFSESGRPVFYGSSAFERGGLKSKGVRYTSLTTTICHDNNNHRTSKHASTSWRSDGSPSCLDGSSHGWVPVENHSTPVPTSVVRLWVAHRHSITQQ